MNTFGGYQLWNNTSKVYETDIAVYGLGLAGETGEVIEILKKSLRNGGPYKKEVDVKHLEEELGDVLWYITAIADHYGIELQEIVDTNIRKIDKKLGVIKKDA